MFVPSCLRYSPIKARLQSYGNRAVEIHQLCGSVFLYPYIYDARVELPFSACINELGTITAVGIVEL